MSKRKNFSEAILNARFKHAEGRCEWIEPETKMRCDVVLKPGHGKNWHGDHDTPDALGGQPTFENCRCLCIYHHGLKTKDDVKRIRKADRQASAVTGAKAPGPKAKIQSAGFTPAEPQRKASKPIEKMAGLPRRSLYVEV
jgi:5-methylcytosine-specific restriction protein A